MLLMLSATVTGEILGRYESAMAVMPVLITFIPMLMGTEELRFADALHL